MSQITTHILDTSEGRPAAGIAVVLYSALGNNWEEIARGTSNQEGRIPDLLSWDQGLEFGNYKLRFETGAYFDQMGTSSFYPYIEIIFELKSNEHYHIPLLLSPFGYSTYRGT